MASNVIWFTSDTHFGHKNIIRYCNRPFKNVWEMNHEMIARWNARICDGDTVYHLGDFSFLPARQTKEIIECLNGNIIMVRGNHDGPSSMYPGIAVINDIKIDPDYRHEYWLALSHYPMTAKNGFVKEIALCGHIHDKWRSWQTPDNKLIYNVGVDVWNFKPIILADILSDMQNPVNRIIGEWKDPHEN